MELTRAKTRILYGVVAALVFAAVLFVVQLFKPAHRQFAKVDDWYTGAPDSEDWQPLSPERVLSVTHNLRLGAAVHLEDKPWKEITREDAQKLSESPLPKDPKLKPILLRGIQLSRYHHQITAQVSAANEVWVKTEAVSRWPLPMLRRPAILLLKEAPAELYVDAVVRDNREKQTETSAGGETAR